VLEAVHIPTEANERSKARLRQRHGRDYVLEAYRYMERSTRSSVARGGCRGATTGRKRLHRRDGRASMTCSSRRSDDQALGRAGATPRHCVGCLAVKCHAQGSWSGHDHLWIARDRLSLFRAERDTCPARRGDRRRRTRHQHGQRDSRRRQGSRFGSDSCPGNADRRAARWFQRWACAERPSVGRSATAQRGPSASATRRRRGQQAGRGPRGGVAR